MWQFILLPSQVLDVQKELLCTQWRAALTQNLHQEDVDSVAPAFQDLLAFTARLSQQGQPACGTEQFLGSLSPMCMWALLDYLVHVTETNL